MDRFFKSTIFIGSFHKQSFFRQFGNLSDRRKTNGEFYLTFCFPPFTRVQTECGLMVTLFQNIFLKISDVCF
nr:MAG TPA: hypothetical protein [Caudoviricetes sp.]